MSKVFVIDANRQPLMACHPAVARKLLISGKAAVLRRFPFTIILNRTVENIEPQPVRLKIDPGSQTTGLAVVNDETGEVVFAAELQHRGQQIKGKLEARRAARRNRRQRKTRYRQARFANRTRKAGWLPPSLDSRVHNIVTWVERIRRWCPISAISQELVKFDTQLLQQPEISGVEYQQGELAGYEVRQYVLEKFGRHCVYCGKRDVALQVEHIVPKSRGGSNRVSNLTLACEPCNLLKSNRTAEEFGFPKVQMQAKQPLTDAAAVNATRWELFRRLQSLGLPLETGSGGLTKYNRTRLGLPKFHWTDAACVGTSTPPTLKTKGIYVVMITAKGHGTRQRCRPNSCGFPLGHAPRAKFFAGYQTGDLVRAVISKGKYAGIYTGRVAIRFRPSFRLHGFDVHPKFLTRLQAADGYDYTFFTVKDGTSPSNQTRTANSATVLVGVPVPNKK